MGQGIIRVAGVVRLDLIVRVWGTAAKAKPVDDPPYSSFLIASTGSMLAAFAAGR